MTTTSATLILAGPVLTSLAAAMLGSSGISVSEDVKSFTAFAMIGAAFGVAFCFFLFDREENKRQTAARIILGSMSGVVCPRVAQKYSGWIRDLLTDPLSVVGSGFVSCFVAYFIFYAGAKHLATKEAESLGRSLVKAGKEYVGMKEKEGKEDGKE